MSRVRARRALPAFLLLPLLVLPLGALLAGCGYSTQPVYIDTVRTVAVPIFDNTTDRRLFEFALTNAVTREIHSRTPWRIAPADRADATLAGRITGVATPALVEGTREVVLESAVSITLEITLTERSSGKVLVKETRTVTAPFSTRRGESVDGASAEAIEKLARWTVQRLEKAW
ncbi:MAG: hypothetical protein HZA54_05325 [Planctomycetes bacterium]|nr:hypothetical protein [Planctomycetota bacterium]